MMRQVMDLWRESAAIAIGIGVGILFVVEAHAQGSQIDRNRFIIQQNSFDPQDGNRLKDALGNFCLNVEAAARAHAANPNVYDHIVGIENRCAKLIKVRVCYSRTDYCADLEVPGLEFRQALLGIRPFERTFTYELRERF